MRRTQVLAVGATFAALLVAAALPFPHAIEHADSEEPLHVVSVLGEVPGQDLMVHIVLAIPDDADADEVTHEALERVGAAAASDLASAQFIANGLLWDQFFDADPSNDFVTQYYNPGSPATAAEPASLGGTGEALLQATHATWADEAPDALARLTYGGTTSRCPSLVEECAGPQVFDGFNDVGWLSIPGCCTLAITWYGTSTDEADVAMNVDFNWTSDGVTDFDAQTVLLHENGHVLGLDHSLESGSVMEAVYDGVRRSLHADDIAGLTSLYPIPNYAPSVGTVTPSSGTFPLDAATTFEVSFSDPNGADDIAFGALAITSNGLVEACVPLFAQGQLWLVNAAGSGVLPAGPPGTGAGASNGICSLDARASTATLLGNDLDVAFNLTFLAGSDGTKQLTGLVSDGGPVVQSALGSITVGTPLPPVAVSVIPPSGTFAAGAPVAFSATFSDANGIEDLDWAMLGLTTGGLANACIPIWLPGNQLGLLNDAATAVLEAGAPGSGSSVSNTQCTLHAGLSSASVGATDLVVDFVIEVSPSFAGDSALFAVARDGEGFGNLLVSGLVTIEDVP